MSVSVAIKNAAETTGEGPHWVGKSNTLLYVDIVAGDVHRWNSITGENEKVHFDKEATVVVPRKTGGYVVCIGNKLCQLDWNSKSLTTLAEVDQDKRTRFNDGKCDAKGRFWAGTMGLETAPAVNEPGQGSLFCFGLDGSVKAAANNFDLSNGLAWTSDNKRMFFADSIPRKIYAFDYDLETGSASNQRVAIDFSKYPDASLGLPDGMCMDTNNNLWVACYSVGKVVKFDIESAKIIQEIVFPVKRTTSCAFGGPNYDELYVTTSKTGISEEECQAENGLPGSIFKVTGLGVRGLPPPEYEG